MTESIFETRARIEEENDVLNYFQKGNRSLVLPNQYCVRVYNTENVSVYRIQQRVFEDGKYVCDRLNCSIVAIYPDEFIVVPEM